jgi:hypothetical protein
MMKHTSVSALALGLIAVGMAHAAGTIDYVSGNVAINNYKNEMRLPVVQERIEAGDTIVSGKDGEVHIITDDRGLIVVRPRTQLQFDTYRAAGRSDDAVVLHLTRGSFRSIAGWIGNEGSDGIRVITPAASLQLLGADHEATVIEGGNNAGSYDKVNKGRARITATSTTLDIEVNQAGFAPGNGAQGLSALKTIPDVFQPAPNEKSIDGQLAGLAQQREAAQRQSSLNSAANGSKAGEKPKIGDLQDQRNALMALEDLFRQYEAGNVNYLRNRLDPSMIGFQQLLDRMASEVFQCKQMRIRLFDTQVQAGPDLAVIQTNWEKRCLMIPAFIPKIDTGTSTFLMHKDKGGWAMSALSGNNPFERTATIATLTITGGPSCSTVANLAGPAALPLGISLSDPDLVGVGSVTVTVTSSQGDTESINLLPAGPGNFIRNVMMFNRANPIGNDGVLEIMPSILGNSVICPSLTVSYTDSTTPNNVPQTVQSSVRIP